MRTNFAPPSYVRSANKNVVEAEIFVYLHFIHGYQSLKYRFCTQVYRKNFNVIGVVSVQHMT
jgi:hypothetical protein